MPLSEANGGVGADYKKVFGLIVDTGVAGGICVYSKLTCGLNNLSVELGHLALPSTLIGAIQLYICNNVGFCGLARFFCFRFSGAVV
ncbi:MAG: ROK family protein [Alphaproteobacteria bacterium]|nr:ROK family protein [Alphaproteobacteria bacterium]